MIFANNWRAEMQGVAAAIDDSFGESVTVMPMRRAVNHSSTPDPTRTHVAVCAVFSWRSEMAFNNRDSRAVSSSNIDTAPLISTRKPCFSFRFGSLPFALRQADRITRLSDGSLFEIKNVKSDGVSRVEAEVVQLGQEPPDYVAVAA
jgi:hypothetical protein